MTALMYLKIDGFKGDVIQKGREGQFQVESFSWGESRDQPAAAVVGELAIVTPVNQSTPMLAEACAAGTAISSATLTIWNTTSTGAEAAHTTLTVDGALIGSYQIGGSGGDPNALDRFTLAFQKLTITDIPHGNTGVIEPSAPA